MKSLWRYLKKYRKECVLAPLFKMLEASFELMVPLVMAAIIDTGIQNSDKGFIFRMCLILLALSLIHISSANAMPESDAIIKTASKRDRNLRIDLTSFFILTAFPDGKTAKFPNHAQK